MARKEYAFYPGCSSQKGASASNYLVSVESMCKTLDIKMTEIPDWNCCGASVSYAEAGELPRHVMNARNFAWPKPICRVRTSSPPAPPAGWVRVSRKNVWSTTPADGRYANRFERSRFADQGHSRRSSTWLKC
jgi:hypothetical protein